MSCYKYLHLNKEVTLTREQNRDFDMPNCVNAFPAGSVGTVIETLGLYLCNIKMQDGTIITVPTNEVEYTKTAEV